MHQWIVALSLIGQTMSWAAQYGIGQKDFVFQDSARNRSLATHVWYPIDSKVDLIPILQKGNPFIPVTSAKDAPFTGAQKFPVVLLSHGSGGKSDKLFWLTDRLVRAGMIVIAVDHQGNMTGDNSADGMMRVWNRPKDLSFALDKLIGDDFFRSRLDLGKVAAAGHSAGGTTVLLLAGARLSSEKLTSPIPTCSGTKDPYLAKICDELKRIDIKSYSKAVVESDYSDPRVTAVVALDPGFVRSFDAESFNHLKSKPMLFLADKMNTSHDQILAKEFARYFPPTAIKTVPESFHMTFIQGCKTDFPKDDPELAELCVENDKKLRIQREVAELSLEFFNQNWNQSMAAERLSVPTSADK